MRPAPELGVSHASPKPQASVRANSFHTFFMGDTVSGRKDRGNQYFGLMGAAASAAVWGLRRSALPVGLPLTPGSSALLLLW